MRALQPRRRQGGPLRVHRGHRIAARAVDRLPAGHHVGAGPGGARRRRRRHPDRRRRFRSAAACRRARRSRSRCCRALREAFMLPLDDVQMALLAQRAENDFVGAPVGVMDQMACTLASRREALFLDTRSLEWTVVPLPPAAELVVFNSGIAHNHSKGDYRTRRAECEEAARRLGVAAAARPRPAGPPARHGASRSARPPRAPRRDRGRARARRGPGAPERGISRRSERCSTRRTTRCATTTRSRSRRST